MQEEHYARHGGVHYENLAEPEEVNRFIAALPEERRENFYELLKELEQAGLIRILQDGRLADGEGKVGGSQEC